MSIFDVTLGERPAASGTFARAGPQANSVIAPSALSATLGNRPTACCPLEVDWAGILTEVQHVAESQLPPLCQPIPTTQSNAEALAAIDLALRQNSARVAVNGLFDIDG